MTAAQNSSASAPVLLHQAPGHHPKRHHQAPPSSTAGRSKASQTSADTAAPACRTYLLRTSSTGIQSSPLRILPHNYLAEFGNLPTTCDARPGYFKAFSVTFSIWWTKHHTQLVAEEMGGYFGGLRCRYAGERIRWTAQRRSGT